MRSSAGSKCHVCWGRARHTYIIHTRAGHARGRGANYALITHTMEEGIGGGGHGREGGRADEGTRGF